MAGNLVFAVVFFLFLPAALDKLGMSCDSKDQKMEIVMKIKEKALAEGRLLTLGEFEDIAHSVLG